MVALKAGNFLLNFNDHHLFFYSLEKTSDLKGLEMNERSNSAETVDSGPKISVEKPPRPAVLLHIPIKK